jgi:hypothetical protein
MKEWYYAIDGQSFGPFPEDELSGLIRDGVVTPFTLVWSSEPGDQERGWMRASDTELNILFPQTWQYNPIIQKPVTNHDNLPVTKLNNEPNLHDSIDFSREQMSKKSTEITKDKNADFVSKFQDSVEGTKKTSEKQLNIANRIFDMGLLQSFILIILSVAIYFLFRKYLLFQYANSGFIARRLAQAANFFVQKLILDPYATILLGIIYRSLKATVIPAIAYILFIRCYIKHPKIEKISPWIAYTAIVVLILLLFLRKRPTVTTFMPWFYGFINTSSMAVVFGFYFHSRKLGSGIAFCVLCILNFLASLSLGLISTIVSAIPIVSFFGGLAISGFRLILNVTEISQVFMLIAVANIIKFLIDLYIHRHFGITPIRNYARVR